MPVPFTQFLLPHGKQKDVTIDLDEETEKLAKEILASGRYRFEIEVLRTGIVSATVSDLVEEQDVEYAKFVPNGPAVPGAIKDMIHSFHGKLKP
jgi:hypothetical protein